MKKRKMPVIFRVLLGAVLVAVMFVAVMLIRLVILEKQVATSPEQVKDYDAIIVLGAQVKPDGTPSVQLSWRLDAAAEAYSRKNVPVVVCGAQGSDEPVPEAEAMRDYLAEKGVPADMILTDPDSVNTEQNLANAQRLLADREDVRRVLIVSSDYHVPRAMALAKDKGFEDAEGLGSPCKPEYWIKNHGREMLSWIKYWLVKYFGLSL